MISTYWYLIQQTTHLAQKKMTTGRSSEKKIINRVLALGGGYISSSFQSFLCFLLLFLFKSLPFLLFLPFFLLPLFCLLLWVLPQKAWQALKYKRVWMKRRRKRELSDLGLGDPVEVTEPDARSSFPHVLHLHLKLLRLRRKMLPLMFNDFISKRSP